MWCTGEVWRLFVHIDLRTKLALGAISLLHVTRALFDMGMGFEGMYRAANGLLVCWSRL
jgi:hypothetical protein